MANKKEKLENVFFHLSSSRLNDICVLLDNASKLREILEVFKKIGPIKNFHLNIKLISDKISLSKKLTDKIIHTIFGLISLKHRLDLSVDDFIFVLRNNLKNQSETEWPKKYFGIFDKFKNDLRLIFDPNGSLHISQKAENLSQSHHFLYRDATLITDLRPVFDDSGKKIIGSIVSHNLSIDYYESGDFKQITFALDSSDVEKLSNLCKRTKIKANTIKSYSDNLPGQTIIIGED